MVAIELHKPASQQRFCVLHVFVQPSTVAQSVYGKQINTKQSAERDATAFCHRAERISDLKSATAQTAKSE